jgi:hypothetical protein
MKAQEEPKQETVEQAAERILANNIDGLKDLLQDDDLFFFYKVVIQCYGEAMAKWQMERMYSEEDMQEYADFCIRCYEKGLPCIIAKDWFELYKKK